MADNNLEILERKLHTESDAKLRERIAEKLRGLADVSRALQRIELELPEVNQTAQKTRVVATGVELVRALGDAMFESQRDSARAKHIDAFLKRVGGMS